MKKIISKKTLSIAMITGLVAVPGLVAAQVATDDPVNNDVVVTEPVNEEVVTDDNTSTDNSTDDDTGTETNTDTNTGTDENTDPVVEDDGDSSVTAGQAQAIAQAKFPNKEVARVDTKNEDNGLVYRVRFTDAVKVDVLASDGTIVKTMAEKNRSGEHRQDGNHQGDDDDSQDDRSNRGRR